MDRVDSTTRTKIMRAVKSKNTAPEIAVRKILFGLGYRYRLHRKNLPGKPDIVFPSRKKVVFVNGCFWHGHKCKKGKLPKSRRNYWKTKIRKNIARDQKNISTLNMLGWHSLTIWQCELREKEDVARRLQEFLEPD